MHGDSIYICCLRITCNEDDGAFVIALPPANWSCLWIMFCPKAMPGHPGHTLFGSNA